MGRACSLQVKNLLARRQNRGGGAEGAAWHLGRARGELARRGRAAGRAAVTVTVRVVVAEAAELPHSAGRRLPSKTPSSSVGAAAKDPGCRAAAPAAALPLLLRAARGGVPAGRGRRSPGRRYLASRPGRAAPPCRPRAAGASRCGAASGLPRRPAPRQPAGARGAGAGCALSAPGGIRFIPFSEGEVSTEGI